MFPILGGRLLKACNNTQPFFPTMFPILGGRLLKVRVTKISGQQWGFPILGGRLLKETTYEEFEQKEYVSNPWREAIEEVRMLYKVLAHEVSNPWREAIEGGK